MPLTAVAMLAAQLVLGFAAPFGAFWLASRAKRPWLRRVGLVVLIGAFVFVVVSLVMAFAWPKIGVLRASILSATLCMRWFLRKGQLWTSWTEFFQRAAGHAPRPPVSIGLCADPVDGPLVLLRGHGATSVTMIRVSSRGVRGGASPLVLAREEAANLDVPLRNPAAAGYRITRGSGLVDFPAAGTRVDVYAGQSPSGRHVRVGRAVVGAAPPVGFVAYGDRPRATKYAMRGEFGQSCADGASQLGLT